jgi:hypothetical protein
MNRRETVALLAALGFATPFAKLRAASSDVRAYGMKPDAAPAVNAAALQKCLKENAGTTITIPGAPADYQVSGTITAPAGTSLVLADGARLRWVSTDANGSVFLRSPTRPGIDVLGDNFRLSGKGQIIGPSPGQYVGQEIGIVCVGAGASAPRRGFEIGDGIEILNWGSIGIAAQFVQDLRVQRVKVTNCGYGGMRFLSCKSGRILSNTVGAIGPGASGNAYGISCTHDSLNYDQDPHAGDNGRLAVNPFCIGFEVAGNTVYDIPLWAGIDFHGAYDCQAHNNNVYNCRHGMLLQGSSNAGADFAGENNSVTGNNVTTRRMNGEPTTITETTRLGISVNGGKRVRHRAIAVRDNSVDGYGDSHNTSSSIQHTNTAALEIVNNRITNWRGYACYSANSEGIIQGNDFGAVADPTSTACVFVAVNGSLRVIGNRHTVSGRGAMYGLYINTPSDGPYVIQGNDFRSATVQQYAGHGGSPLSRAQIVGGRV